MPLLTTDDGPRKLRNVWLGPKGATLPWQWTYGQWAATILGVPAVCFVLATTIWLITRWDAYMTYLMVYLCVGYLLVRAVMRLWKYVEFDTPVSYLLSVAKREWREGEVADQEGSQQFAMPRLRHLSHPTMRAMRWPEERGTTDEEA